MGNSPLPRLEGALLSTLGVCMPNMKHSCALGPKYFIVNPICDLTVSFGPQLTRGAFAL